MPKLEIGRARPQADIASDAYRVWKLPDGKLWTSAYRVKAEYLLRFPDFADFWINFDGSAVRCWPVPGVSVNTYRHLYLNQVLPLALSKQGQLVFHASAVESSGYGLAFVGQSGMGKSTLAASFSTNGHRLLTDDVLHLIEVENGYQIQPSDQSVRLWSDSQAELINHKPHLAPLPMYTSKTKFLADDVIRFHDKALSLGPIYFLGKSAADIRLKPITGQEAMIALVKHMFLLDTIDRQMMKDQFNRISDMVSSLPLYLLAFPRRYDILPEVRQGIIDHAALCRLGSDHANLLTLQSN